MKKEKTHQLGLYGQAIKEYVEQTWNNTYNKEEFNAKWYGPEGIITLANKNKKKKRN